MQSCKKNYPGIDLIKSYSGQKKEYTTQQRIKSVICVKAFLLVYQTKIILFFSSQNCQK